MGEVELGGRSYIEILSVSIVYNIPQHITAGWLQQGGGVGALGNLRQSSVLWHSDVMRALAWSEIVQIWGASTFSYAPNPSTLDYRYIESSRVLICPHWRTEASTKVLLVLLNRGRPARSSRVRPLYYSQQIFTSRSYTRVREER